MSESNKMRMFNTVAVGVAGIFCLLIGVVPGEWPKTGVTLYTLVTVFMGFNPGGFYKCGTLTSRQYAHFVLATIQFMKCIALFVAPAMVAYFVEDERRHDQWRYVHWINGAMLIFVGSEAIEMPCRRHIREVTPVAEAELRKSVEKLSLAAHGIPEKATWVGRPLQ
ncbi:unnamed protein product [Heligmosomoides polygyrus]|uniref:Integral membrane protein n=1 Tax=Heligmosomoides polygyrus TaxID=6339 RepID=A0A183GEY5_HELPZ|nr:unnamed protein product [Heligmosomoides polygyrus]